MDWPDVDGRGFLSIDEFYRGYKENQTQIKSEGKVYLSDKAYD